MTAPDRAAAVEIVLAALGEQIEFTLIRNAFAAIAVDALDAAGWLHDPAYVAALEAVADLAQRRRTATTGAARAALSQELFAALDAVPAAETTSGSGAGDGRASDG